MLKNSTWKKIIMLFPASLLIFASACSSASLTSVTLTTGGQTPFPWPGVPVYRDASIPIVTRINESFAIILPPTALFGWGWLNQDMSAFSLLETKTMPGIDNEANPYGPNAFLFKPLQAGTFQITLYVPSKPPQYLRSFYITVNP